jgi:DNA-binding NarL/FixJ family response regulator
VLPIETELPALQGLPAGALRAGRHLRILVVEDNQDAAQTLRDLLELFGYEVVIAYSGPQGVEAARQFRPQVVLCDIGLPGGWLPGGPGTAAGPGDCSGPAHCLEWLWRGRGPAA